MYLNARDRQPICISPVLVYLLVSDYFNCGVAACGCPSIEVNSAIEFTDLTIGSVANVFCAEGYYSEDGEIQNVCNENGGWSDGIIFCHGCPYLEDQPNAILMGTNSDSMTIGSTQTFKCQDEYFMSGSATVVCQANATWGVNFKCHELVNVALKRETSESSFIDSWNGDYAVDGDKGCMNLFHTDIDDMDRWLLVDFGQTAVVIEVVLYNRDNCYERLGDISIWVGASANTVDLCAVYEGPAGNSETVYVMCSSHMTGRYLKVTGGSSDCNSYRFLQFCELEAMGYFLNPLTCAAREFECETNHCIDENKVCNQQNDCGDWSDETGCVCPSNEFLCDNDRCIPYYLWCNTFDDCGDGSDETDCDGLLSCPYGARCSNTWCIGSHEVCNGSKDCPDNSDEMGCPGF